MDTTHQIVLQQDVVYDVPQSGCKTMELEGSQTIPGPIEEEPTMMEHIVTIRYHQKDSQESHPHFACT